MHQGVESEYGIQCRFALPETILLLTKEAILFHHTGHPLANPTGKKLQDNTADHYGSVLGRKRTVAPLRE
jgi:hypothetical protein